MAVDNKIGSDEPIYQGLSRLQSGGDIFVEGSFARNAVYLSVLQSLRPEQRVRASDHSTGITQGAAQLIAGSDWAQVAVPAPVGPSAKLAGLAEYRTRWLESIQS